MLDLDVFPIPQCEEVFFHSFVEEYITETESSFRWSLEHLVGGGQGQQFDPVWVHELYFPITDRNKQMMDYIFI